MYNYEYRPDPNHYFDSDYPTGCVACDNHMENKWKMSHRVEDIVDMLTGHAEFNENELKEHLWDLMFYFENLPRKDFRNNDLRIKYVEEVDSP